MAKSVANKLRTLYIMDELLEKTDENNRLSTRELLNMLDANGLTADRKSIYDDIETLNTWGMDILYTKEQPAGYYVASRKFELPELKLLVDAVQSSKFITQKKSLELIKKLESMASASEARQLQRQVHITGRTKTPNEDIYYNVDKIHEALMNDQKISFKYYKWNTDKELIVRNNGNPIVISPWALSWDDENYYMHGYDENAGFVKFYRVDKMQKINLTGEKRTGAKAFENFDMGKFSKSTFSMYGGDSYDVTLECENSLIGPILDRFGTEVIIQKFGKDRFRVRHEISVSGQFYGWLTGLGAGVKIISPESVAEKYKEHLDKIRENY